MEYSQRHKRRLIQMFNSDTNPPPPPINLNEPEPTTSRSYQPENTNLSLGSAEFVNVQSPRQSPHLTPSSEFSEDGSGYSSEHGADYSSIGSDKNESFDLGDFPDNMDPSFDADIEIIETIPTFTEQMAEWVKNSRINRNDCNSLLTIIHNNGFEQMPVTRATLLATPKTKINIKTVSPGQYFHYGISKHFLNRTYPTITEDDVEIKLDIGVDGLKVYKCSKITLWPILGVVVCPKRKYLPFLIGCYYGTTQPNSFDQFLEDFAVEYMALKESGIFVPSINKHLAISIRCFCADAPARADLAGVMHHNGYKGCSKCDETREEGSESVHTTKIGELRTDESFRNRTHLLHHHEQYHLMRTTLETIGIQMVSQIPIDPMHLLDLGLGKKLIGFFNEAKFTHIKCEDISQRLSDFVKPNTPSEFSRTCQPLQDLSVWKATDFRQFLCYSGMVVLKDKLEENVYYHFLLLCCAYRLLSQENCKENVETAQKLLETFVELFPSVYGPETIVYNVHMLLHISACVTQFGSFDSFSCYKFENFMQYIKKDIRSPTNILQQVYNRMKEEERFPTNRKYKFDEFSLSSKNMADSFCYIGDTPIKIVKINVESNSVSGHRCLNINSFFEAPLNSRNCLGIVTYTLLDANVEIFRYSDVKYKFFRIPFNDLFVLIPILHQTFTKFG